MWTTENYGSLIERIFSDNFIGVTGTGIVNKEEMKQTVTWMNHNNPVVKHSHMIKNIIIQDAIAYEYGSIESVMKDGQKMQMEVMNVFFRDVSGWKIVFTGPPPDGGEVITLQQPYVQL